MENDKEFIKALHCFARMNSNIDCPITDVDEQGAINCDICPYNQKEYDVCDECKFLETVSNKLEIIAKEMQRQSAKKPILCMNEKSGMFVDYADGHGEYKTQMNNWWRCPCCNAVVGQRVIVHKHIHDQRKKNYCENCGQSIDWSNTNERHQHPNRKYPQRHNKTCRRHESQGAKARLPVQAILR